LGTSYSNCCAFKRRQRTKTRTPWSSLWHRLATLFVAASAPLTRAEPWSLFNSDIRPGIGKQSPGSNLQVLILRIFQTFIMRINERRPRRSPVQAACGKEKLQKISRGQRDSHTRPRGPPSLTRAVSRSIWDPRNGKIDRKSSNCSKLSIAKSEFMLICLRKVKIWSGVWTYNPADA
jgi:hypothetical protein